MANDLALQCLAAGEDGDAKLFRHLHDGRFIYDHSAGVWHEYTGHFWIEDRQNMAMTGIGAVVNKYAEEANRQASAAVKLERDGQPDAAKRHHALHKSLLTRIRALHTARRKRDVLFLAAAGHGLRGDEWDQKDMQLPCANCIVDLKTGKHRPGRTTDYIKTACPTIWRGLDAPCPTWIDEFLNPLFGGNPELIAYVKRLYGYAISGASIEHILPILWGAGRNGKTVLLEIIKYVMGELAHKTETELLLEQRSARGSGSPNSGVLALRGRRLVFASETDEGRRLNTSKVKELTGGDTLNARGVYCRHPVEFKPSHTLMLITNHKPQAAANDFALWRRIHLIPFDSTFVDNPKSETEYRINKHMPEKLKAEASGILAWLVQGCLDWQREGLNPPEIVQAATAEYRAGEDVIGQFIDEMCVQIPSTEVRAGDLYREYKNWCVENSFRPLGNKRFGADIRGRGYDEYVNRHTYFVGIGLAV